MLLTSPSPPPIAFGPWVLLPPPPPPPQPAITTIVAISPATIAAGVQAGGALNRLTFLPPLPLRRRSDPHAIPFSPSRRAAPGPRLRGSPGSGGRLEALPPLRGPRYSGSPCRRRRRP